MRTHCLEGIINRAVLNVRSGSEAQTLALIGPWTNRSVDSERCFFDRKITRRIPEGARSCRHDETAAAVLFAADMLGNIRTQTLRAFTAPEMEKILATVP